MSTSLSDVLAQVDGWEPDTVAVGVTDPGATLATHGPVDEVLPIASLTKPLAAYACLVAIQDGAVHLDEPAGPDGDAARTVRHLLAHASGLPPDADGPTAAPETRRIYSNHGYDLLGELVADRVGLPFAEHLDVEVLQPLKMTATTLEGSPAHAARSTVADLLTFARELLDPTLIDAELHDLATTVAFPGLDGVLPGYGRQSPNDWGLGVEIRAQKEPHWTGRRFDPSTFGHFGRSGSYLWIEPTRRLASVSLADQDFGPWAIEGWPPFSDAVLEALS
jgi:CubicO group peptidase (beta-lactamase class C family)